MFGLLSGRRGCLAVARGPPRQALLPTQSRILNPALRNSVRSPLGVRHGTSEILGEDNRGHIEAGPNEGILFFDNIFPLRLRWIMYLPFQNESALERLQHPSAASFDPVELLRKALPEELPVKVTGIILRAKEGGAFVRFSHDPSTSAAKIEELVNESLKTHVVRPWFNPFHTVHARLVLGRPWLEDLYRPPSQQIKVEFLPPHETVEAKEISQEQLFSIFRPYGKLLEIYPQPTDSKVLPKYSIVLFQSIKQAIMAKNCIHGITVYSEVDKGTALAKLKIGFEKSSRASWIKDWIFNHPRIVIPILAALAAGISIAIFDPIRTWNVKIHIKQTFNISQNPLYRWLASRAGSLLSLRKRDQGAGISALWDERKGNVEQLEAWLMESADTFIVVQGPRGSGKKELVIEMALRDRRNKLVIDCKKIQEARGDSATINVMAESVGYRPVFSWMNSISGLIDLAAQGATGMKTGFSETLDGQLNQILNSTVSALRQVSLDQRHKNAPDANLDDDVWLEAHPEKRPVIVIDNFLHKNSESSIIYDKLAEWAARCTTNNIAHVIFLTTDVSFSKSLAKALPDRVFRQISLSDASPELARRFVLSHLEVPGSGSAAAAASSSSISSCGSEAKQSPVQTIQIIDSKEGAIEKEKSSNPLTSLITALTPSSKPDSDKSSTTTTSTDTPASTTNTPETQAIETTSPDTKPQDSSASDATTATPTHQLVLDLEELDASLMHLGGRLMDLEFLARRIKAGELPGKAVQEIIDQSASEILKIYLTPPSTSTGETSREKKWTPSQAWSLIMALANSDEGVIRYNEMLLQRPFASGGAADGPGGPDAVMQALEQAEMINITNANGRAVAIKPGKPVFLPAFRQLAADRVLAAKMNLAALGDGVKAEGATIAKCEDELKLIGTLPKQPVQLDERVRYLLAKIVASQRGIESMEADMAKLKKVLTTEF